MAMDLDFDRSQLGKEHQAGPFTVTRELVRDFCEAVGESDPLSVDDEAARAAGHADVVAPPTLCVIFIRESARPDINLKFGKTRFLAGQRVKPLAPIVAGDSLTSTTCLKEVYPKTGRSGTMVFMVSETTFTNQRGEKVAEIQESHVSKE